MTSGSQAVDDTVAVPVGRDGVACDVRSPLASRRFWVGCALLVAAWTAAAALLLVML
jgi:hypothetical protein